MASRMVYNARPVFFEGLDDAIISLLIIGAAAMTRADFLKKSHLVVIISG